MPFYAGGVISAQALKIKSRLLKLHEAKKLRRPLTAEEITALNAFTASKSWASKKAIELGLKSVALHGEAADVDVEAIAYEIHQLRANGEDDDSDDVEMQEEDLTSVTPETINELCAQLVQIAGKLKKLECDENEFDRVASQVTDATYLLRLAHSRYDQNRVAKKQSKESTTASMFGSLLSE